MPAVTTFGGNANDSLNYYIAFDGLHGKRNRQAGNISTWFYDSWRIPEKTARIQQPRLDFLQNH